MSQAQTQVECFRFRPHGCFVHCLKLMGCRGCSNRALVGCGKPGSMSPSGQEAAQ
jgi:hypothetical protein